MRTRLHSGLAALALAAVTLVGGGAAPAGAQAEQAVALTVTPSTGLLDGHVVQTHVTGLTPGERYWVAQCPDDGTCTLFQDVGGRPYLPPTSSLTYADSGGAISPRLELRRSLCEPDGCHVKVFPFQGPGPESFTASVPLTFAATGTYQWPQATMTAAFPTPVVERSRVSVGVVGMSPWRSVSPTSVSVASIDVCRDDGELTGADCFRGFDFEAGRLDGIALGGGGGGTNPTFPLPRHLPGGWDCAIEGCVLVVTQDGTDEVVGNPRSQAVPITFAAEWAPFASVDAFIDRAVTGVLGRPPTSAGRARLRAGLPNRSITGVEALVEAATGSRLDADVGEVVRLYRAHFGRPVESAGLTYWVGRLRAGLTPLQMARAFAGTKEFTFRYGGLSAAASITLTYDAVLGREPSPGELQYWRSRMEAGLTKADLVYSFARSPENRSRTNRAVWSTIVLWRLTGFAPSAEQLAGGPTRAAADALAIARP